MNKKAKDEEIEYLSKVARIKGGRVMAIIGLLLLVIVFIATIVLGIMGSRYFMPMLAVAILFPVFLYLFLWIGKIMNRSSENDSTLDDANNNDDAE